MVYEEKSKQFNKLVDTYLRLSYASILISKYDKNIWIGTWILNY